MSGWSDDATQRRGEDTLPVAAMRQRVFDALERAGGTLGRYILLEEVGRGGMGQVWRAYDPTLQREVALKRIRPEITSPEVTARLVAEARAMARLSHPNVVEIFDAEQLEDDGDEASVVLVMELVEGPHLADWVDAQQPSWKRIVEAFIGAGAGLMAAHAAGLLHRDFKPANVLLDRDEVAKVTDFGLAKATAAETVSEPSQRTASDSQELTGHGLVMGTPRYMAPEQHSGRDLTPATDQYAFCVSLWESLCGLSPFPDTWSELGPAKHNGPPPFPRADVPRRIGAAIVRGLQPRPEDRWPSLRELLIELEAGARRSHRRFAATAGIGILGAGILGVVAMGGADAPCMASESLLEDVWGAEARTRLATTIASVEASYARAVWQRSAARLDTYADEWTSMHRQSCEATQLRGDQDEATLDLRMACLRRGRIELQAVIGELQTGRPEVLRNAHHLLGGLPPVSRCGDVDALRAEVEPPLPEDVESVHAIESLVAEARAARIAARYDVAAQRLDQAESLASSVRYGPVRTDLALGQGLLAERQGDYASAEEDFLRAMKLAATHEQSDELTLAAAQLVFVVGYAQHRVEEGLRYAQVARAVNVRDSEYEGATLGHTALVLQAQGKLDEALELHRRAVELEEEARSPDDEEVTDAWTNYASTLELLGRYEEAGRYHRKTLELRERALGADHPDVGLAHGNIGTILYAQGRYAAAEGEYRRALELLIPALGADHPHVATEHNNLANVLQIQGRHADAEQEHRRALAIWTAHFGADHPHTALSRVNLAVSLNYQERHEEAEQELRRAMEVWGTELQGEAHRKVAVTHSNLSLALRGLGKLEDAEAEQRRAIEIQRQLEPEHADIGAYRTQLGLILIDEGKMDEARTQLQEALALRERILPADHPQIDETREILAGL